MVDTVKYQYKIEHKPRLKAWRRHLKNHAETVVSELNTLRDNWRLAAHVEVENYYPTDHNFGSPLTLLKNLELKHYETSLTLLPSEESKQKVSLYGVYPKVKLPSLMFLCDLTQSEEQKNRPPIYVAARSGSNTGTGKKCDLLNCVFEHPDVGEESKEYALYKEFIGNEDALRERADVDSNFCNAPLVSQRSEQ